MTFFDLEKLLLTDLNSYFILENINITKSALGNISKITFVFFFENDFLFFIPELFLIIIINLYIFFFVIYNKKNKIYMLNLLDLSLKLTLFVLFLNLLLLLNSNNIENIIWFSLFSNTLFTNWFKIIIIFLLFIIILSSIVFFKYEEKLENFDISYEFTILVLFSLLGIFSLITSNDFLSFYLSLELQSLAFYVLAALKKNSSFSTEAGLKYFILGAIASSLILFGFSFIYGISGTTNFDELFLFNYFLLNNCEELELIFVILVGFILISVGLFFKLGFFPFHLWIPDVYEGVSTPVLSIFAILPKFLYFSILLYFYNYLFSFLELEWHFILIILSFLSILIGSFGALYQLKLKRLFAFSAISHIGFLGLALSLGTFESIFSLLFYLLFYLLLSLSFLLILVCLRRYSDFSEIKKIFDLKNFFSVNPILAFFFAMTLFSIAGIPPLVGFFSKMFVFSALLNESLFLISILVILISVVSCFYYIRLIKIIFFDSKPNWFFLAPISKSISLSLSLIFIINLFFFIYPMPFLYFISDLVFFFVF